MKDQLVTFETALLAKEKGFNEMCKNSYVPSGYMNCEEDCGEFFSNGPLYTVAPTQSLLQKWLREVHDMHCEVHHCVEEDDKLIYESCIFYDWCEKEEPSQDKDFFNTYEEALEDALFEGLNTIPKP